MPLNRRMLRRSTSVMPCLICASQNVIARTKMAPDLLMVALAAAGDAKFSTSESNLEWRENRRTSSVGAKGPFESQGCFSCAVIRIAAVGPNEPACPDGLPVLLGPQTADGYHRRIILPVVP